MKDRAYFEIRLESLGGLGANLCGKMLGELGVKYLGLNGAAFYMDPSHNKPIHPLTMEYFMRKIGFKDVKILFTESSRYPVEIPELKAGGIENLEAFNKSIKEVSKTLFGSQDYAIIGRR